MSDVARVAGVSGATVSHVVNGTRFVAEDTKLRVEEAIRATGYRHNSLARSLAAGRTRTLGMCVPILTNPYIGSLVNAIESAAAAAGYTLVIGDSQDDQRAESRAVNAFLERRVDGIIMAPSRGSRSIAIPQILAARTALVLVDRRDPQVAADQIVSETEQSVTGLVEHLLGHEPRRIAVLAGAPGIQSTDERLAIAREVLAAHAFPEDRIAILSGDGLPDPAAESAERALAGDEPPDAIISLNNAMTIGAMRAIRRLRLRVPGDVALVAYDDFEWADLFEPRLTAIGQDVAAMGRVAVKMLVSRIEDPTMRARITTVPTRVTIRTSCGCPDVA